MRPVKYFETPWKYIESNVYKSILFDFSHELRAFIKIEDQFTIQGRQDFTDQILSKNLYFIAEFLEFIDINTLNELETVLGEKTSLFTYEDSKVRRLKMSNSRL
jgi:hypothetical protein